MKYLALHQPYFFPYIGYFSLIKNVDIFVLADNLQYMRRSWVNRNRIISTNGEPQYITIPLRHNDQKAGADKVEIDYSKNWEQDIINRLNYYKKRAPYYKPVMEMLDELFSVKYGSIAELSNRSVELVIKRLGIDTEVYRLSEMDVKLKDHMEPDDWGICVCKFFGDVGVYRNAPGGKIFYRPDRYLAEGLQIEFVQNRLRPYDQKLSEFIPGLSVLDVMMFNSPEEIMPMLDDFELI